MADKMMGKKYMKTVGSFSNCVIIGAHELYDHCWTKFLQVWKAV